MTDTDLMTAQFDIRIKPDRPEAGAEMEIIVAPADASQGGRDGLIVHLLDAGGGDLAAAPLERDGESGKSRALLRLPAPATLGHHVWSVHVDGAEGPLAEMEVAFEVVAPVVRPSAWNLPPAIVAGTQVRMSVGLACTPHWSAASRTLVVEDSDGNPLQSGATGPEAQPGTDDLHAVEVELAAPEEPGRHVWRVRCLDPGEHAPNVVALDVHLNVVPPPDRFIRVLALDAANGTPVERARVVAHPFRTYTDAQGRAEIAVPSGTYRVFVSGHQYFPFRSDADLQAEEAVDILAEMHVDRPFDETNQWA